MCLIAFGFRAHPRYRWVVAANRDEWFDRPTLPLHLWSDRMAQGILAGRDQRAGGTWMGVHVNGRFAAVTNVRSGRDLGAIRSRGELTVDFLTEAGTPRDAHTWLKACHSDYGLFNLLLDDGRNAAWLSSDAGGLSYQRLAPGFHAISNGALNEPWPKVRRMHQAMTHAVASYAAAPDALIATLLAALADTQGAPDPELPETGVGIEWERRLAPINILPDPAQPRAYGTRVSTVLLVEKSGRGRMVEQGRQNPSERNDMSFIVQKGI
jgi:uncharacterized protein with NRDE domain